MIEQLVPLFVIKTNQLMVQMANRITLEISFMLNSRFRNYFYGKNGRKIPFLFMKGLQEFIGISLSLASSSTLS